MWPRYCSVYLSSRYLFQVKAYINSDAFRDLALLTTAMRTKRVADSVDVDAVICAIWHDTTFIRTNRMRVQMAFICMLSAISAERPGAIVESGTHRNTNQALEYRDFAIWVIPMKETKRIVVVAAVTIRLLKGQRENDAFFKSFIIFPEPPTSRASCPMMSLLTMALEDGIFSDVSTIDEILYPKRFPDHMHRLSFKPGKERLLVLRNEVLGPDGWTISPTKALGYDPYRRLLSQCGKAAGFDHFTPYDMRRGAANEADAQLSANDRDLLLGHVSGTEQFYASYQSRLSCVDVQGLYYQRGQDGQAKQLIRVRRSWDVQHP
ncbi:hypothetical protein A0H81_08405 [Grifola frondosa]|uniref:Uncharacterized protein n=1 Tax=Grifola frondosa TaxID=5627 RepID=A0A1C7M3U5_GRIFR|nr:hypothetical protein A0H81_08405 [Grifola frondosa]